MRLIADLEKVVTLLMNGAMQRAVAGLVPDAPRVRPDDFRSTAMAKVVATPEQIPGQRRPVGEVQPNEISPRT